MTFQPEVMTNVETLRQDSKQSKVEGTLTEANLNDVVVYGTAWCGDCRRSKRFLDQHQVPYQWVDIDRDPAAVAVVMKINGGRRSVPTLVFPDGSTLTEPSNVELGQKLGIS